MSSINLYGIQYNFKQINGQRIVEPLIEDCNETQTFEEMEKKEIYFCRVPKHFTEMDLLPIFAAIGPIWKFRLLMNFSGETRGFGYLQYFSEEHYKNALQVLNGKEIIKGYRIKLCASLNKKILLIGRIDPKYNCEYISNYLKQMFPIENALVIGNMNGPKKILLIFQNHRQAAISRRVMTGVLSSFGERTFITWYNNKKNNNYLQQ